MTLTLEQIEDALTDEEWGIYRGSKEFLDENSNSVSVDQVDFLIGAEMHVRHLESLAECRIENRVMKEWVEQTQYREVLIDVEFDIDEGTCQAIYRKICRGCGIEAGYGCKSDCRYQALLAKPEHRGSRA